MRPYRLAAASLLVPLVACGAPAPIAPASAPAVWAADLENPSIERSMAAAKALADLPAAEAPALSDALFAALSKAGPPADASAFSLRLDAAAAARLGLEPVPAPDAVAAILPVVRRRLVDRGLSIGLLRGTAEGDVDVVLVGALGLDEAARLARDVARRGGIDLRAVFVPPRIDVDAAKAFEAWRAQEIAAFSKAVREGLPYVPTRPDRRVAPEASPSAAGTPSFVVLVEPTGPADAFDERVAESATGFVGTDGRARVRLQVAAARRADLTRFTTPLVGREVAIVRDGVVSERLRLTVPWSAAIDVLAAGEPSTPPDETARAKADASTIALGRLPRPLAVVPPAEARTASELLAPGLERALLSIGAAVRPAMERLAAADVPAARKTLARRVLAQLAFREERAEQADLAAKDAAARAKAAKEQQGPNPGEALDDAADAAGGTPPPPK